LVSAYLLALRHPVLVARQLADLDRMAPGRLLLAVGVGGDDRHEIEACGVDPRTRGVRTDEMLDVLTRLQTGAAVTHHGEHVDLDEVRVLPAVAPPTPVLVAGRSEATFDRTARFGTGWFGIFCSPERFSAGVQHISDLAVSLGRADAPTGHGMHVWCSVDPDPTVARRRLADQMEGFYGTPFSRFERYCPAGTAEDVAAFIADYVRFGARTISLAVAGDDARSVDDAALVRDLLRAEFAD
jgi:alkanesulfonate monooxygenase SsuD/methylene tetrahydromethanopterin reductase-like flavin-dependent oxidoreductase (luciferase family)